MVIAPDGSVLAEAGKGEEGRCVSLDPAELLELRRRFCSVGERPWLHADSDKICTLEDLRGKIGRIRNQGSRVAFTNGCFDLLHSGHVSYLEHARRTADFLIVGVNSDRSVRALKGAGRPVNSEQDRLRVLAALGCVDFVVLFDEDTPHREITSLMPDVLVKGADWPEDAIVGAAEVKAAGGRVVRVGFEHQCSTTAIIDKIQQ
ncbi:MAG: D-glycero-beta-D-manno-heptose 1-phosphate adenylyltransferase [Desulfobulbus sp.]|nr:MAG: D-glycero-beta-D-manno-heptose 1-phosphate adenylyltransferase [Desulfobulbus sp.]